MKTFFFINLYKNNVITNLADAVPGDAVFTVAAEKTAEFSGTWYDQGSHSAGFAVKFCINGTPETTAGAGLDHFFLS